MGLVLTARENFEGFKQRGFRDVSDDKDSACNAGDPGSIPGLERSPREGNSYPFQYSCLEKSMDRGGLQSRGSQRVRYNLSD